MDKIDTDELRRIVAEATPGPWQQGEMASGLVFAWNLPPDHQDACICEASEANARLIALAPDLAAEVIAARAPAVPDDVAETAKRLRQATFTKGRMRVGIGGQTIEANMRSTFHEVSAWDLDRAADALEAQAAELARLTMALAETEALEMQHGAVIARLTAERDTLGKEKTEFAQWRREETERAMKAEAERDALRAALRDILAWCEEHVLDPETRQPDCARRARAVLNPTGD